MSKPYELALDRALLDAVGCLDSGVEHALTVFGLTILPAAPRTMEMTMMDHSGVSHHRSSAAVAPHNFLLVGKLGLQMHQLWFESERDRLIV